MADHGYSQELVNHAAHALAVRQGSGIKERLIAAADFFSASKSRAMPDPETRGSHERIWIALGIYGSVDQAVRGMTDADAQAVADAILALDAKLAELSIEAPEGYPVSLRGRRH